MDYIIFRPFNVIGPRQNIQDKYRNVVGIFLNQIINNKPMTIFGDGEQTRAFSYIDDSLEPLWNAAILPNASKEIINLGGIEEYSINEANETLRKVIGGGSVVYKEARHEVKHSIPTWKKSADILGFKHSTNLQEGLTAMWQWAKEQPQRERFVWPAYELDKGIYKFWKL
jgi:UDP-glucose 4-epimerase